MKKFISTTLFIISISIFIFCAFPVVSGGDGGEIISAAYLLGIPHPPGYPFYTILGKIFSFLPLGTIAFRVNVLAGFFTAISTLFLFKIIVLTIKLSGFKLRDRSIYTCGGLLALVFVFGNTFFEQGLNAKGGIYTLNMILTLGIIYFLLKWGENTAKTGKLIAASLLLGLGLANHQTIMLGLPVFLIFVYLSGKRDFFKINVLVKCLLVFITGTLVYLYLPIRAATQPILNWGDPSTIQKFIAHITRSSYGKLTQNPFSMDLLFQQIVAFVKYSFSEIPVIFGLLAFMGAYLLFKANRKIFWLFFLFFLVQGPGFILLINADPSTDDWPYISIFILPSLAALCVFAAAGVGRLIEAYEEKRILYKALAIILLFVAGFSFAFYSVRNIVTKNQHNNTVALDYNTNVLRTVEKNGVLFASDDNIMFPLAYLTMVEKTRPDVTIYDDFGWIFKKIYPEKFLEMDKKEQQKLREGFFEETVASKRPVFIVPGSKMQYAGGEKAVDYGFLKKYNAKPTREELKKVWSNYTYRAFYKKQNINDMYTRHLAATYMYLRGSYLLAFGSSSIISEGLIMYGAAFEIGYDDYWVMNNLCLAYDRMGWKDLSIKCGREAVRLNKKSEEASNNLALALSHAGKQEEAAIYYKKASEINPSFAVSDYNTALMYFKQGKYETALLYAEKAIKTDPDYCQAYVVLGNIYQVKNDNMKAMGYLKTAVEKDPSYPEARYNLGAVYLDLGKKAEARKELLKYLELKPDAANAGQVKSVLESIK